MDIKKGDALCIEFEVTAFTKAMNSVRLTSKDKQELWLEMKDIESLIVYHKPKTIDWNEVKRGDIFENENGKEYVYIGLLVHEDDNICYAHFIMPDLLQTVFTMADDAHTTFKNTGRKYNWD